MKNGNFNLVHYPDPVKDLEALKAEELAIDKALEYAVSGRL
jgi:hypothetical protein